jgi:hypothetical protein
MPYTIEVDRKALDRLVAEAQKDALRRQLEALEQRFPTEGATRGRKAKGRRRSRKKGQLSAAGRAAISRGVRKSNRARAKAKKDRQG